MSGAQHYITAKFAYGPVDMAALKGEKVIQLDKFFLLIFQIQTLIISPFTIKFVREKETFELQKFESQRFFIRVYLEMFTVPANLFVRRRQSSYRGSSYGVPTVFLKSSRLKVLISRHLTILPISQVDIYYSRRPQLNEWKHLGTDTTDSNGRLVYTLPSRDIECGAYNVKMVVRQANYTSIPHRNNVKNILSAPA